MEKKNNAVGYELSNMREKLQELMVKNKENIAIKDLLLELYINIGKIWDDLQYELEKEERILTTSQTPMQSFEIMQLKFHDAEKRFKKIEETLELWYRKYGGEKDALDFDLS